MISPTPVPALFTLNSAGTCSPDNNSKQTEYMAAMIGPPSSPSPVTSHIYPFCNIKLNMTGRHVSEMT